MTTAALTSGVLSEGILNYKLNPIQSISAPSLISTINFPACKEAVSSYSLSKLRPSPRQMSSCFPPGCNVLWSFAGVATTGWQDKLMDYIPGCGREVRWPLHRSHYPLLCSRVLSSALACQRADSCAGIVTGSYLTLAHVRWCILEDFHNILVIFQCRINTQLQGPCSAVSFAIVRVFLKIQVPGTILVFVLTLVKYSGSLSRARRNVSIWHFYR